MTTTTNIQMSANPATQNKNNKSEEGTMCPTNNNINMVARIANVFRMQNISKLVATAAVGLALTIGVAMPGTASADVPAVTNPGSYLVNNLNDDFSLVYGTPDSPAKVTLIAGANFNSMNDDFSLVYGTPDSPAKVKLNTETDLFNDDFSMVYGTPDEGMDFSGISAKVRTSTGVTGLDNMNDDFSLVYGTPDLPAKVRTRTGVAGIANMNDDFSLVYGTPDEIA